MLREGGLPQELLPEEDDRIESEEGFEWTSIYLLKEMQGDYEKWID
jgi:hypothetical protein